MGENNSLSEEELELIYILKKRIEPSDPMAENDAVGIAFLAGIAKIVDKVIAFCKENPDAGLSDILTFTCTEPSVNWDELNDDSDDEDDEE